jgi:hypothetical protein|eukprot:COSAG01_NODE_1205_length_11235_cov_324.494124_4_plen_350_part_00
MASSADGGVCTLFVKRLPDRCTADELARAFAAAQVTTTAIKLLKRRRAIVDLAQLTPEAEALLSAGSLVVVGDGVGEQERCCCPVILPDRGGVLPGGASEPDMRALRTLTCPLCAREFPSQRRLRAHLADASAHRSHRPPQWSHERLAELDLSPNAMVSQMGVPQRHTLDAYLGYAAPRWAELPSIVDHIASHHPQSLRVKELLETMECFRLVGQFLYDQQHASSGGGGGAPGGGDDDGAEGGGAIREILDLACGHGLLGVLLAYRFPELPVYALNPPRPRTAPPQSTPRHASPCLLECHDESLEGGWLAGDGAGRASTSSRAHASSTTARRGRRRAARPRGTGCRWTT